MVEAADVVIEVLDARDPLSSRCPDVERFVRQAGASKKLILLLNKIGEYRSPLAPPFKGMEDDLFIVGKHGAWAREMLLVYPAAACHFPMPGPAIGLHSLHDCECSQNLH